MSNVPENLIYTAEHEWLDDGTPATVGITANAAEALGDIVYVELPEVGTAVTAGEVFGEVESTKSVSELYSPVTGTVAEVNDSVVDAPETVGSDPYGAGWLVKITVTETGPTLTPAQYTELIGG
ncbi:glycine cleavage system protein GcvH [Paraoerskovia marina]|uniref:Glycine cleavage system H protein n=1 Tax=Paraoerskovia marina TaxID=545619 RepID=A0A1H1NDZ4_9CELL|nr:glycine cleavage system protein GcvH [Paraoerskovia marina]SDR97124.1 glycine cleavage system H protein [Paraoerskovia marina]